MGVGRPTKNTVDYFPHDCNHKRTMFVIENKFGNNGYAAWFKILEMLGTSKNHVIDCRNTDTWEFLQAKTRLSDVEMTQIIDTLARLNAIDKELWESDKIIWCQNFVDRLLPVYQNRRAELPTKPGVSTGGKPISTARKTQSKVKQSKVKESRVKESREIREELLAPFSPEFQKVFNHFIEMRQMIKRPMTDRAVELALLNLDKLASTEAGKIEILNQSIVNSWQGLFPIDKRKEVNRVGAKQQQPKRFEGHQHIIAGTDEE